MSEKSRFELNNQGEITQTGTNKEGDSSQSHVYRSDKRAWNSAVRNARSHAAEMTRLIQAQAFGGEPKGKDVLDVSAAYFLKDGDLIRIPAGFTILARDPDSKRNELQYEPMPGVDCMYARVDYVDYEYYQLHAVGSSYSMISRYSETDTVLLFGIGFSKYLVNENGEPLNWDDYRVSVAEFEKNEVDFQTNTSYQALYQKLREKYTTFITPYKDQPRWPDSGRDYAVEQMYLALSKISDPAELATKLKASLQEIIYRVSSNEDLTRDAAKITLLLVVKAEIISFLLSELTGIDNRETDFLVDLNLDEKISFFELTTDENGRAPARESWLEYKSLID